MKTITTQRRIAAFVAALSLLLCFALTALAGGGNGDGTGGGKDQPLVLASSSVANGAKNVSQNPEIVLTFSKNVVHFTVRDNNKKCFSMTDEYGNAVPINVEMGDDQIDPSIKRIVTISPKSPLTPGTTYLLKIGGGITSKSGVSIGHDSYISFTVAGEKPTAAKPTTTKPTTTKPTTTRPTTTKPTTTKPTTTRPTTTRPSTTKPTTRPTTTRPSTTKPTMRPSITTTTTTTTKPVPTTKATTARVTVSGPSAAVQTTSTTTAQIDTTTTADSLSTTEATTLSPAESVTASDTESTDGGILAFFTDDALTDTDLPADDSTVAATGLEAQSETQTVQVSTGATGARSFVLPDWLSILIGAIVIIAASAVILIITKKK